MNAFFKLNNPTIQRPVKALLLQLQHTLDLLLLRPHFWEHIAHLGGQHIDELEEERLLKLQRAAVLHSAAEDAAEGVVAVGVAGFCLRLIRGRSSSQGCFCAHGWGDLGAELWVGDPGTMPDREELDGR